MKHFWIVILAVLLSVGLGSFVLIGQYGTGNYGIGGGGSSGIPVATYVVYKDGSIVYVKCGKTGRVDTSGTDATAVIQYALNNLTIGRTWKEKVVVVGDYTGLSSILLPSYVTLEIQGYWVAKDSMDATPPNVYGDLICNADSASGQVEIEICGGHINANKEKVKRAAGNCGIAIRNVDYVSIHDIKVRGGYRNQTVTGAGIKVDSCNFVRIENCECYEADYDNIIVTRTRNATITGNICRSGGNSGIQLGFSSGCSVTGNALYYNVNAGLRIAHYCSLNVASGNNIYGWAGTDGIHLKEQANRNLIVGNNVKGYGRGIRFDHQAYSKCYKNLIEGNNLASVQYGISFGDSSGNDNFFIGNMVSTCSAPGSGDIIRIKNGNANNVFLSMLVRDFNEGVDQAGSSNTTIRYWSGFTTENWGQKDTTGDGSKKVFTIATNLEISPTGYSVVAASDSAANIPFKATLSGYNILITCSRAPAATASLSWFWNAWR